MRSEATGLLIALWRVDLLDRMLPATLTVTDGGVVTRPPVAIDATVFAFAALASVATAIALGLAPACAATRGDVHESLKEGAHATPHGQGRIRRLLIVTEIALALVLLISAGLTIKSFWRLQHVDPGFVPDHLLALEMELPTNARYREGAEQRACRFDKAGPSPKAERREIRTVARTQMTQLLTPHSEQSSGGARRTRRQGLKTSRATRD